MNDQLDLFAALDALILELSGPLVAPASPVCTGCQRQLTATDDTWDGACGFCRFGTINGLPPHLDGLYPVMDGEEPLPVHRAVPNTVTGACFYAGRTDPPAGAQINTNPDLVTCPACLARPEDRPDRTVQQPAAVTNAVEQALRYIGGLPLVRHHRRTDEAWSFLCPVEDCQVWRVGFATAEECRAGWFQHCATPGHDPAFIPAWPDDVPCGPATQPIAYPGRQADSILLELIDRGQAVDVAGRTIRFVDCSVCLPHPEGGLRHQVMTSVTCVQQVTCPKCGARPGHACDRSTKELSPVRFPLRNALPSGHHERFVAAEAADDRRREAGDDAVTAGWAPTLAPTKRTSKPKAPPLSATLRVEASSDTNPQWQQMAYEYVGLGRLTWSNGGTVAHILFEDAKQATWVGNFLTEFYDIPADLVTVVKNAPYRAVEEAFASTVRADADHLLRTVRPDTPLTHLEWAAGVHLLGHARHVLPEGLKDLGKQEVYGGTAGGGIRIEATRSGIEVRCSDQTTVRKVSWSGVAALLDRTADPMLVAEMRTALKELAAFPIYSREWSRAFQWCRDLGMQAWMAARPGDMPPFDQRSSIEP